MAEKPAAIMLAGVWASDFAAVGASIGGHYTERRP